MTDSIARSIRDRIARGVLPAEPPVRIWAGYGSGRGCDGCDQPITPRDLEHELDFPGGRTVRFHAACSETWRRATTGGVPDAPRPGADESTATS